MLILKSLQKLALFLDAGFMEIMGYRWGGCGTAPLLTP